LKAVGFILRSDAKHRVTKDDWSRACQPIVIPGARSSGVVPKSRPMIWAPGSWAVVGASGVARRKNNPHYPHYPHYSYVSGPSAYIIMFAGA